MLERRGSLVILVADDDEDDFFLAQEAFKESGFSDPLLFVPDGVELMDYLHHRGKYDDPAQSPRPDLILLDLNMPKKSGREALPEIKSDPQLKDIPVVIYTTSSDKEDKVLGDRWGARFFMTKPDDFNEMVKIVRTHGKEWLTNG